MYVNGDYVWNFGEDLYYDEVLIRSFDIFEMLILAIETNTEIGVH